jgi:hypothetical protein
MPRTTSNASPVFALLIPADMGQPIRVVPLISDNPLRDMYSLIGCEYVECLTRLASTDAPVALWVDEEGAIKPNTMNTRASIIAGIPLMGDAILAGHEDGNIVTLRMDCPAQFMSQVEALAQDWNAKYGSGSYTK